MVVTPTRPLLITAAGLAVAGLLVAGCSASDETLSSTGSTAPAGRATATSAPGTAAGPGSTAAAPSTDAVGPSQATTADGVPPTTIPDPDTPVPEPTPTEPSTIPASGPDPALIDCGTIYRATGWPTTFVPSRESFECLQSAFDTGTPARLVDREQTDGEGGAILVTTYDVLGAGRVRVTVDATEAADRPQGVTVSECSGLTTEFVTITVSGCTVVGS